MNGYLIKRKNTGEFEKREMVLENYSLSFFMGLDNGETKKFTQNMLLLHEVSLNVEQKQLTLVFQREDHKGFSTHELRAPNIREAKVWYNCLKVFETKGGVKEIIEPPSVVQDAFLACIEHLKLKGARTPGIFKVQADENQIRDVFSAIMIQGPKFLQNSTNPHVVAGVFNLITGSMPESIFSNKYFKDFIQTNDVDTVHNLMKKLPFSLRQMLMALFELMSVILRNTDSNHMTINSLTHSIGPFMVDTRLHNSEPQIEIRMGPLFELLLSNFDAIFHDEINFDTGYEMKKPDNNASVLSDQKLKVVIMGPTKSGKTRIVNLLSQMSNRITKYNPTIGVRIVEINQEIVTNGTRLKIPLEIWDTSGDLSYTNLWPAFVHDANCVILVFNENVVSQQKENRAKNIIEQAKHLKFQQIVFFSNDLSENSRGSNSYFSFDPPLSKYTVIQTNFSFPDSIEKEFVRLITYVSTLNSK